MVAELGANETWRPVELTGEELALLNDHRRMGGVIVTEYSITSKQARRLKRHFLGLRWWQRRIGKHRV